MAIPEKHRGIPWSEEDEQILRTIELSERDVISLDAWFKENGTALMPRKNKIIEDHRVKYPEKFVGVA